jgi:hypothetical protein
MSEWWTYHLSDFLLFAPRTYYRLFELYNAAIWPGQIAAIALGIVILALLLAPGRAGGRVIAVLLAAAWLWVAWAYLWTRYATINWAAPWFAGAFAVEALSLLLVGAVGGGLSFAATADRVRRAGVGIFLFALAVQPLIGPLLGRPWRQIEVFGIAPDPTVIATLGILTATAGTRWELTVIPLVWCAINGATLWTMEAPDACIVPVVMVLALFLAGYKTFLRRPRGASA